jgi:hypothetical protein
MKHGGQPIKQVLKRDMKLKYFLQPKTIPREQLQHRGIGSHLVYVNLQHCLSNFNKFQLLIVNRLKNICVISNFQLKITLIRSCETYYNVCNYVSMDENR